MDALSGAQMEELWGVAYQEDYSRIRAVSYTHLDVYKRQAMS